MRVYAICERRDKKQNEIKVVCKDANEVFPGNVVSDVLLRCYQFILDIYIALSKFRITQLRHERSSCSKMLILPMQR